MRPLFEMLTGLLYNESESNWNRVLTLMRKTFKEFPLFKKSVDDETIEKSMDFNMRQRVIDNQALARMKWEARKSHTKDKFWVQEEWFE